MIIIRRKKEITVPAEPKSGYLYADLLSSGWSGQEDSFVTGDDGFKYQNGHYDRFVPENPAVTVKLDPNDPFNTTLRENNVFGNPNRFTAFDGTQNYVASIIPSYGIIPFALFLDHYYGVAFTMILTQGVTYPNITSLANAHTVAQNFSRDGYDTFFLMGYKEMLRFAKSQPLIVPSFQYPPFNANWGSRLIVSSSITTQNTAQAYSFFDASQINVGQSVGLTRIYLFIKNIQNTLQV